MGEIHGEESRVSRTSLVCRVCDRVFYPKNGSLKQKTCSRICGHKLRIENGGTKKGKHYEHLQRARVDNCLVCGKEYRAIKDFKDRKQKYCSRECYEKEWIKNIEPRLKRASIKGEANHSWKGDDVTYSGLHRWIANTFGRTEECEMCGTLDAKKYEWANKNHKYKRNKEDWMRLCTRCHRKYDYENN